MPTIANIERLAALRTTLARVAAVQRGELIRAEDWNTVVGTVLDLAQVVLGEQESEVLPEHKHSEQVSLGWLEPGLRALLEKGPLAEPQAAERLLRIERQLAALAARLDGTSDGVGSLRDRLAEVVTRDLVRESQMTSVGHRVEGLADPREDVLAVRRSLETLGADVRSANELAARLMVDGQPVDLGGLQTRLGEVEKLRDALKQPDGQLLSAAGLEARLTQLTNTLVTESELSEVLAGRQATLGDAELAGLEGRLSAQLGADVVERITRARQEIDASVALQLGDVDAAAARAVSGSLPGLQAAALEAANASVATAIGKHQSETKQLLEKRLAETQAATERALEAQRSELSASVGSTVAAELSRQLPAQLGALGTRIDKLTQTFAATAQRLDAADSALKAAQLRMDSIETGFGRSLDAQHGLLLAEMAQRDAAQSANFDQRLKERDLASKLALENALDTSRSEILRSIETRPGGFTDVRPGGIGGLAGGGGRVRP